MEREEQIENMLVGLMNFLEIPTERKMLSLAIIKSLQLHEEMLKWVASFHDSEDTITLQSFTAKLNELIAEKQINSK